MKRVQDRNAQFRRGSPHRRRQAGEIVGMQDVRFECLDPGGDELRHLLPVLDRVPDAAHGRAVLLGEGKVDVVHGRRVHVDAVAGLHLLVRCGGSTYHFHAVVLADQRLGEATDESFRATDHLRSQRRRIKG
ncbi:hypothetical protein ACVJMY_003154 [Bradyrhizobium diazoefficiens]